MNDALDITAAVDDVIAYNWWEDNSPIVDGGWSQFINIKHLADVASYPSGISTSTGTGNQWSEKDIESEIRARKHLSSSYYVVTKDEHYIELGQAYKQGVHCYKCDTNAIDIKAEQDAMRAGVNVKVVCAQCKGKIVTKELFFSCNMPIPMLLILQDMDVLVISDIDERMSFTEFNNLILKRCTNIERSKEDSPLTRYNLDLLECYES